MFLQDSEIKQRLKEDDQFSIEPEPDPIQYQPATVDVRLSQEFLIPRSSTGQHNIGNDTDKEQNPVLNPRDRDPETHFKEYTEQSKTIEIQPGDFILGSTVEKISVPPDIISLLNGRSTLGRYGIIVHATAGLLDPGFEGYVTLEISNISQSTVELPIGMRVGQIMFGQLIGPANEPYGSKNRKSKYQGQSGPTAPEQDHDT